MYYKVPLQRDLLADLFDHAVFNNGASRRIARELADLTDSYTSHAVNSSVGLVLASIGSEDLTWLLDYCHERWGVSGSLASSEC